MAYKRISANEAKEFIDNEKATLVDVRTPEEYRQGYINGAVLLPLNLISFKASDTLPNKDEKIIIYCMSGSRSAFAAKTLVDLGYNDVYDMGGIISWPYGITR